MAVNEKRVSYQHAYWLDTRYPVPKQFKIASELDIFLVHKRNLIPTTNYILVNRANR